MVEQESLIHSHIADAMVLTQEYFIGTTPYKLDSSTELKNALELGSAYACNEGVRFVIGYLQTNHPREFSYIFSIKSTNRNDILFSPMKFQYHEIFVAQGSTGMWYAGAPSNYLQKIDLLTELYRAPKLDEVLAINAEKVGGSWPTVEFIDSGLQSYSPPTIYPDGRAKDFMLIERDRNTNTIKRFEYI